MLLGRDPSIPFIVEREIRLQELQWSQNEIIEKAFDANSGLKAAELQERIAQRKVQVAKSSFYPRLDLVAGYAISNQTRNTTVGNFISSDFSTNTNDASVSLVLSFNLFNDRRDRIDLNNARIKMRNQEIAYQDAQLSLLRAQTSLSSAQFQTAVFHLEIERIIGIIAD